MLPKPKSPRPSTVSAAMVSCSVRYGATASASEPDRRSTARERASWDSSTLRSSSGSPASKVSVSRSDTAARASGCWWGSRLLCSSCGAAWAACKTSVACRPATACRSCTTDRSRSKPISTQPMTSGAFMGTNTNWCGLPLKSATKEPCCASRGASAAMSAAMVASAMPPATGACARMANRVSSSAATEASMRAPWFSSADAMVWPSSLLTAARKP